MLEFNHAYAKYSILQNMTQHPSKSWLHTDYATVYRKHTVFIQIQDDFNWRKPHKTKMSSKQKNFTINCIHLLHKVCQILSTFTNQCHCLHLHSQCLHLLTLTPNIPILFTVIPQHINIISLIHCIGYTHFLKPFTVTPSEMHCHAIMIHTD